MPELLQLAWDKHNETYIREKAPRGLTADVIEQVSRNDPKLMPDYRPGRSASHHMIGPDDQGRFWTVAVLETEVDWLWRPITGWPSTNSEIRRYREEGQQ